MSATLAVKRVKMNFDEATQKQQAAFGGAVLEEVCVAQQRQQQTLGEATSVG